MIDLSFRSEQNELLDTLGIPQRDLFRNLYELDLINQYLGGHKASIKAIKEIIKNDVGRAWRIVDMGCGGGDSLRAIERFAKKNNIKVELTGVDILKDAIAYAHENSKAYNINYLQLDFNDFGKKDYDIAYSSLFCHHLYDEDLKNLMAKKLEIAEFAFINDLHRHYLAYYSIKLLTRFFSKSYLVKNDACLSVARSFKREDLNELMKSFPDVDYKIKWNWAFRWTVLMTKKK